LYIVLFIYLFILLNVK